MADLKRSDFHAAVNNNINQYAKDQAKWWKGSARDDKYMDQSPLVELSHFDRGTDANTGDVDASNVVDVIKAEAERCTSMRKVYTARHYSGSNYTNGDHDKEWGIAALNNNYRQSIHSLKTAGGDPTYISTRNDADRSNLSDLIQTVQNELYERIHNGEIVDLSVCHSNCHSNCHGSRSRR